MEAKGASVVLAFMAGVSVGLIDKSPTMVIMAFGLAAASLWQYRIKE